MIKCNKLRARQQKRYKTGNKSKCTPDNNCQVKECSDEDLKAKKMVGNNNNIVIERCSRIRSDGTDGCLKRVSS